VCGCRPFLENTHKKQRLCEPGLENTQVLLQKPAGRLNAGFFTGFSGKTGFLKQVFSLKMSIFGGQYQ
jgi:hypothetical protein